MRGTNVTQFSIWGFRLGILAGIAVAIALLSNAVSSYLVESRMAAVINARRDITSRMVSLESMIRSGSVNTEEHLDKALSVMVKNSDGKLAWAQARNSQGKLIGSAGLQTEPMLTTEFVAARLRSRQPIFKVAKTPHFSYFHRNE